MTDIKPEPKRYAVTLPVAGSVTVFVEAHDEEEALNKAFDEQDWRVDCGDNTEPGEFETMQYTVRGNVSYVPCSKYSVEEDDG